ncbi:F-box protein [Dorcoceras hygrometricum]|uniref:F-box protein n=1 Tax=Dorcoceras hygrometricum TaxID=472368 RepID=A0A2Z7BIM3_9LAMI|nr:F-box protein [Dorcoceras hygrometricum]
MCVRSLQLEYDYPLKLTACAPAYTWARDQLAHQLSPECASSRICTALCSLLCITHFFFRFRYALVHTQDLLTLSTLH